MKKQVNSAEKESRIKKQDKKYGMGSFFLALGS